MANRVDLTIVTPGGVEFTPAIGEDPSKCYEWRPDQDAVCTVRYIYVPQDTDRGMFLVTLAPTFSLDPNVATAPCGNWTIRLKNAGMVPGQPIQVWVRRDDTLYGHPRRGRQSYFVEEGYKRFDPMGHEEERDDPACRMQRGGLLNAIGTGRETVVIGGFLRQEMRAAKYSAGGPITPPRGAPAAHRDGPDALCVSDDSLVQHGLLAAGSRSGSVVAMNGTSAAAPQITREIARRMAQNRPSDRWAIQALAADSELAWPNDPKKPTPQRGGAGRILLPPRARVPREA
jgi:hypothetical protein